MLTRESREQVGRLDLLPQAHHIFFPISSQILDLVGEADFTFLCRFLSSWKEIFTIKAETKTKPETGFKCPESKIPGETAFVLLLGSFSLNKKILLIPQTPFIHL